MKWISFLLIFIMLLSGCGTGAQTESKSDSQTESKAEESSTIIKEESSSNQEESSKAPVVEADEDNMFTQRDQRTELESAAINIELNGDFASCSSGNVSINGSTVTIKADGTYVLTGTLDDGMIIVDVPETAKPQLVLNGVTIHSETSAPI